ncbi:MAG: RhuM family protein [Candidatus Pacebacteria bacterium]|nr:RhuM family protein [Candidatus Paceibacterota bacterium]
MHGLSNLIDNPMKTDKNDQIVLYTNKDNKVELRADTEKDTLWATQAQIGQLFDVSSQNVTMHLKEIFKSGELAKNSVCKESLHTGKDGKRYTTQFYNLDAIIAVGYRVNSKKATKFRIWATGILREYLINGFSLNKEKLAASQEKIGKKDLI